MPESQILKISDFGLARARQEQRSLSQEQFSAAGTYAWMAPERLAITFNIAQRSLNYLIIYYYIPPGTSHSLFFKYFTFIYFRSH